MSLREPEPASGGYTQNGFVFVVTDEDGVVMCERPDAGWVPTLDAPPPKPRRRIYEQGTEFHRGEAVMPLDAAVRKRWAAKQRAPVVLRRGVCSLGVRAARGRASESRPGRSRSGRRSGAPSRDGPSDSSEGDGEGPPSPVLGLTHAGADCAPSNSQPPTTSWSAWEATTHGFDTVSFAWRPGDDACHAFLSLPQRRPGDPGSALIEKGRDSLWVSGAIHGMRLGLFRAQGLLVAEGRLAAMCSGSPADQRLLPSERLRDGVEHARSALCGLGVIVGPNAFVRRLDLASELSFSEPAEGLLFLQAWAAGVRAPKYKQDVISSIDGTRVETVGWRKGSGPVVARMYDAGVCHGTNAPGARLRFERQHRPPKRQQRTVEALLTIDLRALFLGLLPRPLFDAPSIKVATPSSAMAAVMRLNTEGAMTAAKAERLIGTLEVLSRGWGDQLWAARTRTRRLSELRGLGLALDFSGSHGDRVLELRPLIEAMADLWAKR